MQRRSVDDALNAVAPAAAWAEAMLVEAELAEDLRFDVQVCLEEALANLIMHGKARDGDKNIALAVDASRTGATLLVTDRCVPFDVTDLTLHQQPSVHDENRVGGHGLVLLRKLAGAVSYRTNANGNALEMRFGEAAAPADERALIRSIPVFAKMPDAALSTMLERAERIAFAPGEVLLKQGEESAFALILLSGEVAVVNESAHGEAPVAQIPAPALVGEIGALAHLRRTASVRARTAGAALKIGRDALLFAGEHEPDMLVSVIGQLGSQTQSVNNALGLYAAGLSALERDDFDPSILAELNNPSPDLRNFADAFHRLAQRVTQERRSRAELASAVLIQRAMLPAPLDDELLKRRCSAFAHMKPAREVSGDLFDLELLDSDRLVLAVGDVCGKGLPASLFMCASVTALRLAVRQHQNDLSALIAWTNDALCAQNAASMFTTLFYGVLDLKSGHFDYVNCGHNPPMLIGADGSCKELPGSGSPLGFFPGQQWDAHSVRLGPRDGVFLFSDGVTEAMNAANEEFGDARLADALRRHRTLGGEGLVGAVMADVATFVGGAEQSDDITCLAAFMR